jgi:hypothetical protein
MVHTTDRIILTLFRLRGGLTAESSSWRKSHETSDAERATVKLGNLPQLTTNKLTAMVS